MWCTVQHCCRWRSQVSPEAAGRPYPWASDWPSHSGSAPCDPVSGIRRTPWPAPPSRSSPAWPTASSSGTFPQWTRSSTHQAGDIENCPYLGWSHYRCWLEGGQRSQLAECHPTCCCYVWQKRQSAGLKSLGRCWRMLHSPDMWPAQVNRKHHCLVSIMSRQLQ